MIRLLLILCLLAVAAFGFSWFLERPGDIVLTWQGYRIETSVGVGLAVVIALAMALAITWSIIRIVFRLPSIVSIASRQRKRGKGYAALSRGMIAAGAGDARQAAKAASEAQKHLPDEPLALLLKAQAAQVAGDHKAADLAFTEMVERPNMKLLGYRGLHTQAQRRGDVEAAHHFAQESHKIAPLPWSAKAVLDHQAVSGEWEKALATLQSNVSAKLIDKKTAERQRAVLETALAQQALEKNPPEALRLARLAAGRAPDLVPAVAIAARLLSRNSDIRKAAKLIEIAWLKSPHPDLADIYLDLRAGDSNADRLARAQMLTRLSPQDPESRMTIARAALNARKFAVARAIMEPLVGADDEPTVRMCLIMAELEDCEHGATGNVRGWLARASRAPRDEAWIADGVTSETWAPVSPVTGRLDAFRWQRPPEGARPVVPLTLSAEPIPPAPAEIEAKLIEPIETHAGAAEEPEPAAPITATPPTATAKANGATPIETAPAEVLPPERPVPKPVIFPLPAAPDDPGSPDAIDPIDFSGLKKPRRSG